MALYICEKLGQTVFLYLLNVTVVEIDSHALVLNLSHSLMYVHGAEKPHGISDDCLQTVQPFFSLQR